MPPDAVRTDSTQGDSPKGPRQRAQEVLSKLIQMFRQSPAWQMVLAVALIVVALIGLCRLSGLADQLRPLAMPTVTPAQVATRAPQVSATATRTLLPTPSASPTVTETPVPVILPGGRAVVAGTGAEQLRMRAGPGLTQDMVATLSDGTGVNVLEGPESADGYKWWKVQTEDGQQGWVAGDWLVPTAP